MTLTTLGYSALQLATLVRVFYNFEPERREPAGTAASPTTAGSSPAMAARRPSGLCSTCVLLWTWFQAGSRLSHVSHPGLFGLLLIILGFQTFVFTLLFQMIQSTTRGTSAMTPPAGPCRSVNIPTARTGFTLVDRFGRLPVAAGDRPGARRADAGWTSSTSAAATTRPCCGPWGRGSVERRGGRRPRIAPEVEEPSTGSGSSRRRSRRRCLSWRTRRST